MHIFDKRPLSLILCISLCTFVISSLYETAAIKIIIAAVLLFCLIFTFLKPSKLNFSTIKTRIATICALIALLSSFLYFDLWFKAYDRYDTEVNIKAEIEEFETYSTKSALLIKTQSIDNTSLSEYKLLLYLNNAEYYGYSIGSKIELIGRIEKFESNNSFDAKSYYFSQGVSGVINEVKEFKITDVGAYPLSYKIKDFRSSVARRIIINSDNDSGGLLCALLLGAKEYLPTGAKLSFSRIGISHILALSGMHLAILSLGLTKLLMRIGLNKKHSTLLTILFTIGYMIITGMPVSVMRAGFMLIISSLLFLLSKTRDSMTSLFISVSIICMIEPYAVFDMSLWLSAFATLGIVVIGELQSQKYEKSSLKKWISSSLFASFFAICATFAISSLNFN